VAADKQLERSAVEQATAAGELAQPHAKAQPESNKRKKKKKAGAGAGAAQDTTTAATTAPASERTDSAAGPSSAAASQVQQLRAEVARYKEQVRSQQALQAVQEGRQQQVWAMSQLANSQQAAFAVQQWHQERQAERGMPLTGAERREQRRLRAAAAGFGGRAEVGQGPMAPPLQQPAFVGPGVQVYMPDSHVARPASNTWLADMSAAAAAAAGAAEGGPSMLWRSAAGGALGPAGVHMVPPAPPPGFGFVPAGSSGSGMFLPAAMAASGPLLPLFPFTPTPIMAEPSVPPVAHGHGPRLAPAASTSARAKPAGKKRE
jgi:hypothetical protein